MFSPTVQLKSGGYIVINQTEALVAIDVNSGRSTREHSIEDTALKTNSEASAEIARQLRLRDLAGLIVIDFIDMDEKRNNRVVERKLKDALKSDRARIQVGRISHFGLLEMSRQRIRTSVLESSTETCPHCGGTGHVRSVSSVALQLLRAIDETLMKGATHNLIVRTRSDVAIYVLNNKRAHLRRLEERFKVTITITTDPTMTGQPAYAIDRGEQVMSVEQAKALAAQFESEMPHVPQMDDVVEDLDGAEDEQSAAQSEYGGREDRSGGGRRPATQTPRAPRTWTPRRARPESWAARSGTAGGVRQRRRNRTPKTSKATRIKANSRTARRCKLARPARATARKAAKRTATASAAAADGAADAATAVIARATATPRMSRARMAATATSATAPTMCHRQIHHHVTKAAHLHR